VIIDCSNGEGGVCSCDDCRRLRTAHKAESALIVNWAGNVAERLEKRQPGVFIIVKLGSAYEKPPAGMRISDRIAIALSPETVDQKTPYESSIDEGVMAFLTHLTGWRELPARVIVEHSCGNHLVPASPFPDIVQLFTSIELYHYNMVDGCVIRFPGVDGVRTPFAELRAWMAAELMWDHYQDTDLLVREWMKGVYGNARGPMNDYWKHVKKLALQPNNRITVRTEPFEYITDTWLAEADRMLTRAYAISMTDSTARNYVRRERFGLRTIQLYRALSKTPSNKDSCRAMIASWLKEAKTLGYERVSAAMTCREFAEMVTASLKK